MGIPPFQTDQRLGFAGITGITAVELSLSLSRGELSINGSDEQKQHLWMMIYGMSMEYLWNIYGIPIKWDMI